MVDELFDRTYRESRGELNAALSAGFDELARKTMAAFEALHRVAWSAPWNSPEQGKCK